MQTSFEILNTYLTIASESCLSPGNLHHLSSFTWVWRKPCMDSAERKLIA